MRSWFSLYQTVYWILLGADIVSVLVFLILRVTKGGFWGAFLKGGGKLVSAGCHICFHKALKEPCRRRQSFDRPRIFFKVFQSVNYHN